jgi:CubicO group peptidase (beta-lactamase class C family)
MLCCRMLRRRDFPALLLPVVCRGRLQAQGADPEYGKDWEVRNPEDAGFQPAALEKLTATIKGGAFPNTHAVLIEHDGRLIYEQYFAGSDQRWGQPAGKRTFEAASLHDLRSASKSVTSAVLGIALATNFEKALVRPIGSFFPHLKLRPELDAVTLHSVLTMTAGLECNEMTVPYTDPKNDERQMSTVKDPVALVLSRRLRDKPGATWYYDGGLTQVLAGVVKQITGKPFAVFAKDVLFTPLGITQYEWLGAPIWDPPMPAAASGLRMRARDLARFGSVFLHRGMWQGRQIVPASWVELSMRRHVQSIGDWHGAAEWGYGYQWWIGRPDGHDVAAARGNGNQRVFVVAKERLVITIFAGEYNKFEGHSERLFAAVMAARTGLDPLHR